MDWAHSQNNPKDKTTINKIRDKKLYLFKPNERTPKNGNIRINSTSKIKKIKVTRKNWIEKVIRLFALGLNPHSNGLIFSRSNLLFLESKKIALIKTTAKQKLNSTIWANINILKNKDEKYWG